MCLHVRCLMHAMFKELVNLCYGILFAMEGKENSPDLSMNSVL
jgi:hypothetical protein